MTSSVLKRVALATALAGIAPSVARAQPAPATRLVREITLGNGARGGNAPVVFTDITRVHVGANGDIYVEQPADNVIRQFDSTGRYVRDIGRKGRGPGETEALSRSGFIGDTLWTLDGNTGLFSLFSAAGQFYSAFRPPEIVVAGPPAVRVSPSALLASGMVLYTGGSYGISVGTAALPAVPQVVTMRDGTVRDTVGTLRGLARATFAFRVGGGAGFFTDDDLARLLNDNPIVTSGDRGAWIVAADQSQCATRPRYTVARLSLRADTLWRTTVECPRIPVPHGFTDSVVVANRDRIVRDWKLDPASAEQQVRPKIGEVTSFGAVAGVHVGRDGSIWIRPLTLQTGPEDWIRVDAPSSAPQRLTLPARTQLRLVVDATHFWAVVLDADDVPTLVRFRVVR